MVSVTTLQRNLFKLFALGFRDSVELKVHHKGRVFICTIQRTGESYIMPDYAKVRRRQKRLAKVKKNVALDIKDCETCGFSEVNGICINKKCPSYQTGALD